MTVSLCNSRPPQRHEADSRLGAAAGSSSGQAEVAASELAADQEPLLRLAPLPPRRLVPRPEGLLQIHTAPFRGSFAAVFSQALRTAGLGSRVLISQFLKGGVAQGLEGSLWLCGRLQWLRPATLACLVEPVGGAGQALETPAQDAALLAVREVWEYSRRQLL
ncbi:MAG: hypothetical protein ACKN89_04815, partial [Cyanobium sp.]